MPYTKKKKRNLSIIHKRVSKNDKRRFQVARSSPILLGLGGGSISITITNQTPENLTLPSTEECRKEKRKKDFQIIRVYWENTVRAAARGWWEHISPSWWLLERSTCTTTSREKSDGGRELASRALRNWIPLLYSHCRLFGLLAPYPPSTLSI